MKKITLLLFAIVAFCGQANAQLAEGFEAGVPPAGWAIFDNGIGLLQSWKSNTTSYTGASAAFVQYESSTGVNEDWLVTSLVDLSASTNAELTFFTRQAYTPLYNSIYEIRVSTASQTTAGDFTSIVSWDEATLNASPAVYEEKTVDLSAYDGQMVYVAFVMTNDDGDSWYVDDVLIADAPTCTEATVDSSTVVADCGASTFTIDVVVSALGDATDYYDGTNTVPITGSFIAGPYNDGDLITLELIHSDPICNYDLGTFSSGCPPVNDACVDAIAIACGGQYLGDTTLGAPESPDPGVCGTTAGTGGAVWYTYTGANSNDPAATPGTVGDVIALDLGLSTFDTKIRVFEGACGSLVCVGGNDDTAGVTSYYEFPAIVGTEYYVLVHGFSTAAGQYTLDVSCVAPLLCTLTVVDSTTIMPDCDNSQYSIDVEVSTVGDGTFITDGLGGSFPVILGTATAGPYAVGTTVTLTVEHSDGACDYSLGDFIYDCPPDCASTPLPIDGAVDVPVGNVAFSWEAPTTGLPPTSYNLYAGITPTGDDFGLVGNFTELSADITLSGYNTLFYWVIRPVNGSTEATGCDVWSFTTGDAPVGAVCENAIMVTSASLPYTTTDDTSLYGNDYVNADVPPLAGAQYINGTGSPYYISGDDVVYAFTPDLNGTYNFDLSNTIDGWVGFWLFEGCPFTSVVAYHTSTSGTSRSLPAISLVAGTTYYVVISTWPTPDSTPYTLDITLEALSIDEVNLNNAFTYYPNPVSGTLTLNSQKAIQNVAVYNMLGQEVLRAAPNTVDSNVDMSNLKAGTYFVKVTVENATKTIKIIKK